MKKLHGILFLLSVLFFISCGNYKLKEDKDSTKEKLEEIIKPETDSTLMKEKKADMDSVMNELEDEDSAPEQEDENAVK